MNFTTNSDGSLSVTWSTPVIYTPWVASSSGTFSMGQPYIQAPGQPLATASFGDTTGGLTDGFTVLHAQYGSAYPASSTAVIEIQRALPLQSAPLGFAGATYSANIPATFMANPLAQNGIYCIVFLGFNFTSDGMTTNGVLLDVVEYGSNVTVPSRPPTAPTNLQIAAPSQPTVGVSGIATWNPSSAGSTPLLGYEVRWGTAPGGPYPNVLTSTTTSLQLPTSLIPADGTTRYFVVRAYADAGSPTSAPTSPFASGYWPTQYIVYNAPQPPPPQNNGGGI